MAYRRSLPGGHDSSGDRWGTVATSTPGGIEHAQKLADPQMRRSRKKLGEKLKQD